MISFTDYYTSTTAGASSPGGVAGYVQDDKIQQGSGGTPILQDSETYISHSDAGGNTIYPEASATTYRNSDGTGAETTSYSYTWFAGTNDVQSMATSLPIVSASQNGPRLTSSGTSSTTTARSSGGGTGPTSSST